MTNWSFEHSIYTKAKLQTAWNFLSDMSNQTRMEAAVERIELDGLFETGTKGRTITKTYTQEWELSKVIEGKQFVITGENPDFQLSFSWEFEEEGNGTRLTQCITATGSQLEKYMDLFRGMEQGVPNRLMQLAKELDVFSE